jgi:hypothetical protein
VRFTPLKTGEPHRSDRFIHPTAQLVARHAEVLRPECDVFLHHGADDLVVRILEHEPHPRTHVPGAVLVRGVHPVNDYASLGGNEQPVQQPSKRRLP